MSTSPASRVTLVEMETMLLVAAMRIVRAVAGLYALLSVGGLVIALNLSPEDPLAQLESTQAYTVPVQATTLVVTLLFFIVLRPLINETHAQVKPGETLLRSVWQI